MPRAIGMFGHSLNPNYFINPPAYTYLLHILYGIWWGGRDAVGAAFAADPSTAFAIARAAAAACGVLAVALLAWAGVRMLEARAAGLVAALLLAVAFLPVHYSHLALNDVPTLVGICLSLVGTGGHLPAPRADARLRARRRRASGWPARRSTRAGSCCCRCWPPPPWRPACRCRGASAGSCSPACSRGVAFLIANPYALLDSAAFHDGLTQQSEAAGDAAGKLGQTSHNGYGYYLWTLPGGWAGSRCCSRSAAPLAGAARLAPRADPDPGADRARASSSAARAATGRAGCCRSTRCSACWPRRASPTSPPGSPPGSAARGSRRSRWASWPRWPPSRGSC